MFKSVKIMLIGVGLALGAMQVQAADVTDAMMFQDNIVRGYVEQDARSGDVEVGAQYNTANDYVLLLKQSDDDFSATVAKTMFLADTVQFVPSVEYTVGEAGDQSFHNVYVEGLTTWQALEDVILYGAAGYNFMNAEDADDFSTLKMGADYFYGNEMVVGYHFTRNHTREATNMFPDEKFMENEHEVSLLLTSHEMFQPYVALRVTDEMGGGYETSGAVGLNVIY